MKFKFNPSLLLACLLICSCKKETATEVLPAVETSDVTNIDARSALSGGIIKSEGPVKLLQEVFAGAKKTLQQFQIPSHMTLIPMVLLSAKWKD